MDPFWIVLELRVKEVVVTTEAIGCAKLPSNRHHHYRAFLQAGCPSYHPANSTEQKHKIKQNNENMPK